MYFFSLPLSLHCCCSLLLAISILTCSFFVQERAKCNKSAQRVDKLFLYAEYISVCVCSSCYKWAPFLLNILSIFPFFAPFCCNRQMKVKKNTECIEYIHRFKDDEAKRHQEPSTTFRLPSFSSFFFFYSIYLFALSSRTARFEPDCSYYVSKRQYYD